MAATVWGIGFIATKEEFMSVAWKGIQKPEKLLWRGQKNYLNH